MHFDTTSDNKIEIMDATISKSDYSLYWKLTRYVGLYQILNPNCVKIYGYNPYHIVMTGLLLGSCAIMVLNSFTLYYLMHNFILYLYFLVLTVSFSSIFYKLWFILRNSDKIWDCFEITKSDFLSYKGYDRKISQRWTRRSKRFSYSMTILIMFATIGWTLTPIIFNNTYIITQNIDGSFNKYRLNIFNINFMVMDKTYNGHFYVYYFIELVLFIFSIMIVLIISLIMVIICHAICGHLETICKVIELLGHGQPFSHNVIGMLR